MDSFYQQSNVLDTNRADGNHLYCEDHPGEPITNFCFASLKPLCPGCIDFHNKVMRQNNVFPEIDTFRNVKLNCAKKCKSAVLSLQGELAKLESQVIQNPRDIIEEGIYQIRRAKEKLIAHINQYMDQVEIEFAKSVNEAVAKAKEFNDIHDKIRSLVQELEHLMHNIESPNSIPTVKKICMIDLKALLEKFRGDVNHTLATREALSSSFSEVSVDESKLYNLHEELIRFVSLNKKTDKLPTERSFYNSFPQDSRIDNGTTDLGYLQFHKDYRCDGNEKFAVSLPEYFEPNAQRKYLHFFQNHENRFHYIDLASVSKTSTPNFETIDLNLNFRIPSFHKSIVLPNGDIYVVGGCDADDQSKKMTSTYQYDWNKNSLVLRSKMNVGRSSFGICYMNKAIWVVGGLTDNSVYTRTCEKFDIQTGKWSQIAELNHEILSPCVTGFNNKYLFKFGGCGPDDKLEPIVERYDPARNVWNVLHVKIEIPNNIKPSYFKILSTSACAQINNTDIYVFGGYLEDNTSSNETFIFRVNEEGGDYSNYHYTITNIGAKTLRYPEAFWNNTPIVFDKKLYALQNVQTSEREDVCLDDKRRLIAFDSYDWLTVA